MHVRHVGAEGQIDPGPTDQMSHRATNKNTCCNGLSDQYGIDVKF